jgi:hypothetical protein
MSTFKTLPNKPINGGIQYLAFYPNGYGASIVQHNFSYGHDQGLWELAVIKGKEAHWGICYDTPITSDVLGHLSEAEVEDVLLQIEALEANPKIVPYSEGTVILDKI